MLYIIRSFLIPSASDSDEPLLSGSGNVSKDCTEELMELWTKCIEEWKKSEEG